MVKKNIFEKLKQSENIPQLPQVMLRLVKACSSEKTSIDELTRIISADPSLTSRLIQIISSPYINLPKEVNSIKTAVVYLGMDTIRNIAISTSAMRFFSISKLLPEFDLAGFWYHSYKCGVIARQIARENDLSNPDEFFLAGLLHDIGRLILIQNFPQEYEPILKENIREDQILSAEMKAFGTDTPRVSAWLFGQWNLNPLIADAVLYINEEKDQVEGALSHVKELYISNILAQSNALGKIENIISLTDIPQYRLEQIAAEAEDDVSQMAKSMGINMENIADEETEKSLTSEIKDFSLFYGTLQSLLKARDVDAVLNAAQNGLKIIFNISRVFYFLLDEKKNILTGFCAASDKSHKIIKSIALPMSNTSSLLVKCVKEQTVQNTLEIDPDTRFAISDIQIARLIKEDGLYCVPVVSADLAFGVMALGVDKEKATLLDDNRGLVDLFSKQMGICIQGIRFHSEYAQDIHEKKMEAYSTLTDKVIHEVNNPLAIIKNYIETLRLKLPDRHPAQDELVVIGEEMNRVSELLDRLKSFSSPKIGGFEPVDINQLCQSILDILKKSILLPKQIEATISIDPEIPHIKTDRNGIKQIFINLVKNASEAMETGGRICVSTKFLPQSAKIMIDEKKRIPGSVEIVVADNGPGIDETIRKTVFDPYVTTKKGGTNSGLGLSIVHSIVRDLNGKIRCESKPGKGTRFIITLPVSSSKNRQ
ncbi:MAG: HDOD domain-containing protein [Proteobacteria bacterium]|nr:HDOD domain-containing protein [Pseudomonadota bacterium]MBU1386745.1 HDOD domain-containing protein [Pseudomonadota bacterium]MBU1544689.1 HDOD domain-containing protein [Pseudomonadota bacterium]MBU2480546.1 HDOD domain-containing protein [Pseudomonadota bacterium]